MLRPMLLVLACFAAAPVLACEDETESRPDEAEEAAWAPSDDDGPVLLARAQAAWRAYLAHLAEQASGGGGDEAGRAAP
jgi:hypothetical protein